MFVVYCSQHGARVLLSPANIEAIVNGESGMELQWRCTCGATGVEHIDPASPLSFWAA
jgi:hypothetical protein